MSLKTPKYTALYVPDTYRDQGNKVYKICLNLIKNGHQVNMSEIFQSERRCSLKLILWATLFLPPVAALLLLTPLNQALFMWLNSHLVQWLGGSFWAVFTNLGDGFFLFPLAMVLVIKNPKRQLAMIITIILAALALNISKSIVDAARPFAVLGDAVSVVGPELKSHSTPSGHSGTVFLLAGLGLIYLGKRGATIAATIAILTGISRVAVGAHWPADVVLGAWIGLLCSALGALAAHRLEAGIKTRAFFILLGCVAICVLPTYDNGFQDILSVRILQYSLALAALVLTVSESISFARDLSAKRTQQNAPGRSNIVSGD